MAWLFGALARAGLQLPEKFDLEGIVSLILQILGVTYAKFRERAVALVGAPVVAALEQAAEVFKVLLSEGISGLWQFIKEQLANLKSLVLDAIFDFIKERVIIAGITWIISLLNPASAFIKACKAIYDIVMFFVQRGSQVIELVNAVLDSVTAIAQGALGAAVNAIENALAKAIPVAIGFLASLLGLGGISDKIRAIIEKVRATIDRAIDWVISKAVQMVKAAGKLLGFGRKAEGDPETDDPEHDLKVQAGLAAIDKEEKRYIEEGKIAQDEAEKVAAKVKSEHPVFKTLEVVSSGENWDYDYTASEIKRYKGAHKESGQLQVKNVRVRDEEIAKKVKQARAAGGQKWELAVEHVFTREIIPEWEEEIGVPIKPVFKGEKEFDYPSMQDLARLKVQRGHRAGKERRRPEMSMEVKERVKGGPLREVRAVEITLVEDFTAQGDFARHKVDQFTSTIHIFKEKYGNQLPITFYFYTPREATDDTKDFIVGTLLSQGMPNVQVEWIVVHTDATQ
jgi:hypothetical protein